MSYCLDSILNNTYRELEVICVNDGSPDSCGEILERYERMDERIKVITKENGGVSSARNVGLDAARGEWIAFIDADDAVHYRYFEFLLEAWEKDAQNADVVVCGDLWHEKGELPNYMDFKQTENRPCLQTWEEIRHYMLSWAFVWGKIYKRELFEKERCVTHLKYSEDVYFNMTVLSKSPTLRLIVSPAARYLYRNNPESVCNTLSGDAREKAFTLLLESCPAFPSHGGRIVSLELVVRFLFGIGKYTSNNSIRTRCRKGMLKGLVYWGKEGFLSLDNFVMWVKFCLYYMFPSLEGVGMVVHKYRNRLFFL